MSKKIVAFANVGDVTFQKRKGSRSVKLRLDVHGRPVVTMPPYLPYKFAEQFVLKHVSWLQEELAKRTLILHDGMRIGRVHILRFEHDPYAAKPTARVTASQIVVKHPGNDYTDPDIQETARLGAIKSLKREASHFLPKRLADIAAAEGYEYSSLAIRQQRGRWGSCSSKQEITLNCFLMQLPVEFIDYVILHELAHTRVLHHGPDFWEEFEAHLPNAKQLRKEMKKYQPTVPATVA